MMITSQCPYCFNEKMTTNNKKQWMTHLFGHKDEIIHSLNQIYSECIFYPCMVRFTNERHAISHYRHDHKRYGVVDWAFSKLPQVYVPLMNNGETHES